MIDPRDAAHPWTQSYEGWLPDVFRLQANITEDLARQFDVEISPEEKTALDDPPTTDPEAHDLYLRAAQGPHLHNGQEEMRRALGSKVAWVDEAVARDPRQAIPLHGTYMGSADAFIGMDVNINVVSAGEDARA